MADGESLSLWRVRIAAECSALEKHQVLDGASWVQIPHPPPHPQVTDLTGRQLRPVSRVRRTWTGAPAFVVHDLGRRLWPVSDDRRHRHRRHRGSSRHERAEGRAPEGGARCRGTETPWWRAVPSPCRRGASRYAWVAPHRRGPKRRPNAEGGRTSSPVRDMTCTWLRCCCP